MGELKLTLDKEKKYLLGLSGGADSVCLFHLLKNRGYSFSVAHVNHGIRGDEADRDGEFCRRLAEENGIDFHLLRADIPAIARESGESLEEAARRIRYDFFEKIMCANDIPVLLTAHNADDNAETLLLSLVRGCSPSGACGINRVRALPYGEVQRPLLSYSKEEIVTFCHENRYEFVTDSTNSDISYPRNRIRQKVLPELRAINPEFLAAFARFTEAQRGDCEYLDSEAEKYARDLDCETLASLPRPIASRALSLSAYRAGAKPEAGHIERMLDIARKKSGSLSLPGGIIASCNNGRIVFKPEYRIPKSQRPLYPDYGPVSLNIGKNRIGDGILTLVRGELTNDSAQVYNLSTSAHINLDRIKEQLYARPRKAGDRILIGGKHRSVKKLISEKIPNLSIEERRALPVICHGEEIVWVPGIGVSDSYRRHEDSKTLTIAYNKMKKTGENS